MPKEGHVSMEDLKIEFGYSASPSSLYFFTKEENAFREKIRKFFQKDIAKLAEEAERENSNEPIQKAIKIMGAEGINQLYFPKEVGGKGYGITMRTIRGEELAAVSYAIAMGCGTSTDLFGMPVAHHGNLEQKKKYLKPIMDGKKIGGIAISEPTGGCDAVGGMRTKAEKKGDEYIISGEKRFITNGSTADYILLYAITNPKVDPQKGITAFVFETDVDGFEVVKDYQLMGRYGTINSHLRFNKCRVPAENVLGRENEGFKIMMGGLDGERISGTSGYVGCARSAFEIALKYAGERMQFGQPIRRFEGVSFKLSEMYAKLEAMRLLMLRAARMIDAGLPASKEAAAAKFFSADVGWEIVDNALQIVGGIGYTKEYPVERYMRDFRVGRIAAGSSEILRFLVQRELYREIGY